MKDRKQLLDRAYIEGRESAADSDATNPYDYDGIDSDFAEAWSDGREDATLEMGEEFADYCDSSMRDCYE